MHCGIALKPATAPELLFPYLDAGLVDMVRHCNLSQLFLSIGRVNASGGRGRPWADQMQFTTSAL